MTTPREDAPDLDNRVYRIVERAANMGGCSQTHHEHLLRDARNVLLALGPHAPTTPREDAIAAQVEFDERTDHLAHRPYERQLEIQRLRAGADPATTPLAAAPETPDSASTLKCLDLAIAALLATWDDRAVHSYHAHAWADAVRELRAALEALQAAEDTP